MAGQSAWDSKRQTAPNHSLLRHSVMRTGDVLHWRNIPTSYEAFSTVGTKRVTPRFQVRNCCSFFSTQHRIFNTAYFDQRRWFLNDLVSTRNSFREQYCYGDTTVTVKVRLYFSYDRCSKNLFHNMCNPLLVLIGNTIHRLTIFNRD